MIGNEWERSGPKPVDRDDAGAPEADIVLQGDTNAFRLARAGGTAELKGQLAALRETVKAACAITEGICAASD